MKVPNGGVRRWLAAPFPQLDFRKVVSVPDVQFVGESIEKLTTFFRLFFRVYFAVSYIVYKSAANCLFLTGRLRLFSWQDYCLLLLQLRHGFDPLFENVYFGPEIASFVHVITDNMLMEQKAFLKIGYGVLD